MELYVSMLATQVIGSTTNQVMTSVTAWGGPLVCPLGQYSLKFCCCSYFS